MKIGNDPRSSQLNIAITNKRRRSYLSQENDEEFRLPSKKDDTLFGAYRSQDIGAQVRKISKEETNNVNLLTQSKKENAKQNCKSDLRIFFSNKFTDYFLIALIIIYVLLVFVNIVLDSLSCDNPDLKDIADKLLYIELGIVTVFIIEIFLKIYAFGFWGYFKDKWYLFDCGILIASFVLVILDICYPSSLGLTKLRGIFRLFRVFLLIRKANEFSIITKKKYTGGGVDVKSPVEKILDLLRNLQISIENKLFKDEIKWAIDVISTNKIYEPVIDESTTKERRGEAQDWVRQYTIIQSPSKQGIKRDSKRKSIIVHDDLSARRASLATITSILSNEVMDKLEHELDKLSFDIFDVRKETNGDELSLILHTIFRKNELYESLGIKLKTFLKFSKKIQQSYYDNPYHNSLHGADIIQTINYFLKTGDFIELAQLSDIEIAAMYIAAAVHDIEHPGYTNAYMINTRSELAIKYNDKSVLENHHISRTFKLIQEKEYNIFENFSREDYIKIRERMVSMVLATDMAHHFTDIGKLKARLSADFDCKEKDKYLCMEVILHCCDISNPAKPWNTCKEWTFKVLSEFWNQGDRERELGLPISYLCDRYTTNTGKSQIGFIDFIVQPTWELIKQALPKIELLNIEINKSNWKELIEFYDIELAKINEERAKNNNNEDSKNDVKKGLPSN